MADKPKPEGPKITGSEISDSYAIEQTTFLLGGLLLLGVVSMAIMNFIHSLVGGETTGTVLDYIRYFIWPIWKIVAVILTIFAGIGIAYNLLKIKVLTEEEDKIFNPHKHYEEGGRQVEKLANNRWDKILKLANSLNASDWRLAIIEADVMLEEVLHNAGFMGDSIGEMLKGEGQGSLNSINEAWEAHKIRNEITHTGADFELTDREAKRVIALFEKVFRELGAI